MSNAAKAIGPGAQVVQSYGTESLIGISRIVVDIREYHIRCGTTGRPRYKQIQQHPPTPAQDSGTGILSSSVFARLYGKRAPAIRKLLLEKGYSTPMDGNRWALTWKFRNIAIEDFDINLGVRSGIEVYRSLDALLWTPMPEGNTVDDFIGTLRGKRNGQYEAAHRITDTEYWFRLGNVMAAFRFSEKPSPELISLIELRLHSIQHEKMQNYFHIISSFNADAAAWMKEQNRSRRFFDIVENLIAYTWRPFDMESCEVSIDAAGDEGLIASGSLRVDFSENGLLSSQFDKMGKRFPPVDPEGREFSVNDVSLRAASHTSEASLLSLRMVSRTNGNVDPRRNMLTHRFVKLFVESVGKLIDVIIPVISREEAVANLRWQSFLDSLRLQALEHGEDLHRIVTESLRVLRKFFAVSGVSIFSEDRDLGHMLQLFGRSDAGERLYSIVDAPLSPAVLLARQLVVFPIREIQGGRILLYFELPRVGHKPLNPEIPDHYLMGTELWNGINEEALILGVTDLRDYVFFIVTECLTANPKAVMDNLNRRLPVRSGTQDVEELAKLTRRILARYSRFFDLFGTLSGNLESGLAYMRGRRDNLTGLYNRQHFTSLLNESFSRPGYPFGLMFLDMDNFKIFNDAVSHDFGDKLLISLANRMIETAENMEDAVPGRFGGDEFCFSMGGVEKSGFENAALTMFRAITERPLVVSFYFDDRSEGDGMEINLIAFLHRLMRPDVGSRQASRAEYVEKPHVSPKNHVIDVWKYYRTQKGEDTKGLSVPGDQVVADIQAEIEDKILYNKIFPDIDEQLGRIIRLFITLQLKDFTTNRIREHLVREFGVHSVERHITLKVSAGLAHNTENRLRSLESLFKAADGRAYLAKHNGRNCMFGVDGQQLA